MTHAPVTAVIGAGLAGTLMALLLARRGERVTLYEARPDPRLKPWAAGRSINLALAARGMHALEHAGLLQTVLPTLIPMRGRMLHDVDGGTQLVPYGQRPEEVIYSVSRPGLNLQLLEAAEHAGVELLFEEQCTGIDITTRRCRLSNTALRRETEIAFEHIIAADGAGSVLRQALTRTFNVASRSDMLTHGYKELTIPARDGRHAMDANSLHLWPRGRFMLIALPNLDGSFTATLFLPHAGEVSFAGLDSPAVVENFFQTYFPDAYALMPQLAQDYAAHPVGEMGTVYCDQWSFGEYAVLIGDAAHAIVPFHGQGMNCAFEDCVALEAEFERCADWSQACANFARTRRPQTDAIAAMALENYLEMRDTVRSPKFHLQKMLSLELERRFPDRFIPRYSMVMFHHEIPYAVAFERGLIQTQILEALTQQCDTLEQINWHAAQLAIETRLARLT